MFYEFRQNNTGGSFIGPAITVIVEAGSADEANRIAEEKGLYFNGCDEGSDCPCCGDRWYEVWRDDGSEVPSQYGKPIAESTERSIWAGGGIPSFVIYRKDGSEEVIQ